MKSISLLLISFVILSGTACNKSRPQAGGQPAQTEDTIRVGEISSLTGSEATFGQSTHQGIQMAIQEINAAGGVQGKKLQLITMDDQSKPDEAATAATKLITQDRITALLGEVSSSRSLAMAPIAQNYRIPMITPSSTNPKVTQMGDFIFRVCFIDPFQGSAMAKFALNDLKIKKVAVLTDVKSDYSTGLASYFIQAFKKGGGEITNEQSYESGNIDFKSQLTAIRAKTPQAIYVPGYYTEVGLIARQARELGISAPLLGGDGWDSPKLTEIGGGALDASYFTNHYSNENQAPQIQRFIAKYKSGFGVIPDGLSAMGYDAAMVLGDALKRSKTLNTADIRSALANTRSYPGVTGTITIDSDRNAVKSAVILKIAGADFKYQTTVNP